VTSEPGRAPPARLGSATDRNAVENGAQGESVLFLWLYVIIMHKHVIVREKMTEADRMRALSVLPAEVKDAYLDVTRHHHRLLERLAQR